MPGASSSVGVARAPLARALHIELVQERSRLLELGEQWKELWSRIPDATPFQSPDWVLPWSKYYAEGPLLSYTFWCESQLIGIAPLYIYKDASTSARRLFLLGTGNTDYLDVTFDQDLSTHCAKLLFSELQRCSRLWDECELRYLRPSSPLLRSSDYGPGFTVERENLVPCPAIDLRATGAAHEMLEKAAYYTRRLQRQTAFAIEQATPESFNDIFDALVRLHQARWHAKQSPGMLATPRDQQFQRTVARNFLKSKILRMYALRLEQQIAAVIYAFCHQRRTYFYLSGFDPEFRHLSVATLVLAHAVEEARREGSELFDFLAGREPYKYKWGAQDQPVFAIVLSKA